MDKQVKDGPLGELVIKTIAMPADTNRYGDIFGGWLVSQMDLGGAILAHECSLSRMATVAIDKMIFIKPVYVGDIVSCFASVAKRGTTSIRILVEVWTERLKDRTVHKVAEGIFVYVNIDSNRKPVPIQWKD